LLCDAVVNRNSAIRRREGRSFGHATLIALSLLAACGPGANGPPPPDSCLSGQSAGVDSVYLQPAGPTTGGQGALMMVLRIGVTGANPPACLAQSTSVELDTPPTHFGVGGSSVPLNTYAQPDGSRLTHDLYVVLSSGGFSARYIITTRVGALSVTGHYPPLFDMSGAMPVDMAGHD
jgi:hypothetical protein